MRFRILLLAILACLLSTSLTFAQSDAESCDATVDSLTSGQMLIDTGDFAAAQAAFTCAIEANPTEVDAYRGRVEASLLNGDYTLALDDYNRIRARALAEHPDAFDTILAGYEAKLAGSPDSVPLLTGYSFALWWASDYEGAVAAADRVIEQDPENIFALLFRGSSEFYLGDSETGEADVSHAIDLNPDNIASLFILADAYTYATEDYESALEIALKASDMGLNSPRLLAMIATDYLGLGDESAAAQYFAAHIKASTTEYRNADPLAIGDSIVLDMVPGLTYDIPLEVEAGEHLTIMTSGDPMELDSFIALIAPDGQPVTGNDDFAYPNFSAGFETDIDSAGTYLLMVSTFTGAGAGELTVTRS